MPELNAKLFGTPAVSVDGREITLPYKKADALLYYLILKRKTTRSELIGLLYEDTDSATALKNLRHAIYTIRKAFAFDPLVPGQRSIVEFSADVEIACDVYDFERGDMLSAYHGEFLKDFNVSHSSAFDAWLSDQRNLYQSQYLHQLLAAEKEAYYAGKLDLAEKYGTEYIAIDPLEESAFSTLMQVYRDQKKFRKALGLYHTLCKNLSDEFSISPLKETSALYYQIVDAWNTSTYKLEVGSDQQLIGKDAVLHKLVSLCNGSRLESDKICALIQGKTGVGKTYLINYILHQYDFSGWAICQASCYQSEMNTVLAPWNTIMLQLIPKFESENIRIPDVYIKTAAGLFPCLSVECQHNFSGISSDYPAGADYLAALESTLLILSTVAKKVPVLLILEDIHWIDNNSADLLSMLLHRLRSTNITIICTSRDILQPYAQQVLNNAVRDKLLDVYNIDAFSQEETTRFVNFYAPGRYSQKEIDNLYQSTEGNGLFLVQLLDSMHESNGLKNIPASADSIIQMRLAGLSSDELQVLDVISVFRDWAPFDILTSLLTKTPLELLYLCDQLKQKNLLTESTRGKVLGYSFTHERVKAMLSQRQSESARRILHLRAAQYLEAQLGSDGSTDLYDQLVQHFTAGGDTFKAFKYKVLSLDAFAGMCYELMPILTDGSDALTVKEDGLTGYFQILERELASLRSTQFGANAKELDQLERQLLYVESRYYIHGGEYDAGLPVVGQLLKSSTTAGDWQMAANAHLQFIYYAIQTYDLPVMREHLRLGMQYKSRLENTPDWGKFLRLQGLMYLMIGEYDKCRSWLDRSISFFESLDADGEGRYVISIAGAYNYIAETYRLERKFDKALEYYDKAILFNQRRGSYPGAAIIYTDYGVAAYQSGEKEVARELLSYAEELYQSFHEYSQMPIALSYLSLFDVEDGQYVSAAARLSKALDVGRKMGSPWWNGITLYITWKIRLLLEKQAINVPELSALWPQDKRKHCIECLDCLHRLEPRTETAEMEQALEALNAEKAES